MRLSEYQMLEGRTTHHDRSDSADIIVATSMDLKHFDVLQIDQRMRLAQKALDYASAVLHIQAQFP